MKEIKIGDKIISIERARELIDKIFDLRSEGSTQEEVAQMLGVERTFISRLEGIGEVRRSKEIALICSGIMDEQKVRTDAKDLNVDFLYLNGKRSADMKDVLWMLDRLRGIDYVVFVGKQDELALLEKVLDKKIVYIPLEKEDLITSILNELAHKRTRRSFRTARRGEKAERGRKRESWIITQGS